MKRQATLAELQQLALAWNIHSNRDRTDLSMYEGILKYCDGDCALLRGYVHDLQMALGLVTTEHAENVFKLNRN
jgi:hypothetical protein